jgi:predicted XRE-type DNA-binding protein
MRKKSTGHQLANMLGVAPARGMEAVIKAQLIAGVANAIDKSGLTHQELAKRSGLPRSAVTGILTGSLQKITIDRVLRLVEAVGLVAEIRLKKSA